MADTFRPMVIQPSSSPLHCSCSRVPPLCMCAVPKALRGSAGVALEVEDARDLAAINYARQGNAELYSEDMLVARHGLRADPRVSGGKGGCRQPVFAP